LFSFISTGFSLNLLPVRLGPTSTSLNEIAH
jgi:hypothetical protein